MMADQPFTETPWIVIARYLAGELSERELDEFRRWVDTDPLRPVQVEELRRVWRDAANLRQHWDAEAALRQIKRPVAPADRPALRFIGFPKHRPPAWQRTLRVVAPIAALLAVVVGGGLLLRKNPVIGKREPAWTQATTPPGQRAQLRLMDGTEVVLAPASTIRYAIDASGGPRRVYLDGQASFVVPHNESRPFTVETTHGIATDLGTRFVIQAYPEDSVTSVAVEDGKVSLRTVRRDMRSPHVNTDSLLLLPDGGGTVSGAGRLAPLPKDEIRRLLGWIDGRLEFQNTRMSDVAVMLGRWYGINVRLVDSAIAHERLTASFREEPLSEVLHLLRASLNATVEQHGTTVDIRNR